MSRWKSFMNTPEEWHSFVVGLCEVICPWPPQYHLALDQKDILRGEYHYYVFGRAVGFIALVALIILVVKLLT